MKKSRMMPLILTGSLFTGIIGSAVVPAVAEDSITVGKLEAFQGLVQDPLNSHNFFVTREDVAGVIAFTLIRDGKPVNYTPGAFTIKQIAGESEVTPLKAEAFNIEESEIGFGISSHLKLGDIATFEVDDSTGKAITTVTLQKDPNPAHMTAISSEGEGLSRGSLQLSPSPESMIGESESDFYEIDSTSAEQTINFKLSVPEFAYGKKYFLNVESMSSGNKINYRNDATADQEGNLNLL